MTKRQRATTDDLAPSPAPPLVVMVFLHSFAPGGVERVALRLCGAWAADPRIDLRLVMGRTTGVMRSELPAGVMPQIIGSGPISTAGWESLWMILVLLRAVRRQRPDVLFAAGNTYAIVAVVLKLLLGRRCPVLVLKVSNDLGRADMMPPVRRGYRWWLRIQGRTIDRFTGLAPPMQAEIEAAMAVPPGRVTVIEDPALAAGDLAALAAIGAARGAPPRDGRRYVAIGRLARQKNFGLLLQAFALARGPGDCLAIVGEGAGRAGLERRIADLGLGDCVSLPGHGAVAPALAAADVMVLSSDYEALPAVVVEALASGLPVVATEASVSMRGLVGDFGTIVACGDAVALAAAMRAQPALTAAQRQAAAAAMAVFTVERAAGRYRQLFENACADARPENAILPA